MKLDKSAQFWLDAEQRRKQVVPHVWFQEQQKEDLFSDFHGGDPQLAVADRIMRDIEAHVEEFKAGGGFCTAKLTEIRRLLGTRIATITGMKEGRHDKVE